MKRYYDLTFPFCPEMCYPKSVGPFKSELLMTHEKNGVQVQNITTSTHTGTHIDAPFHFLSKGKMLSEIPIERFIGRAVVLDLPKPMHSLLSVEDVLSSGFEILPGDMVFFNTHQGVYWEDHERMFEFSSLSEELAQWLVEKQVNIVGVDASSVDISNSLRPPGYACPIHNTLLGNDILIIECLNLTEVPSGYYRAHCLPMSIKDSDGAPVRVICETLS